MKTGRNGPCPCGSGKKYKKCCSLKEQIRLVESNNETEIKKTIEDNINDDMSDWLLNMHINFRKRELRRKPHIKEYERIRRLHSEVSHGLAEYHESGKFEHKFNDDVVESQELKNKRNKKPKVIELISSVFDFETREGSQAFYDMIIYKSAPNTNCLVEEFLEKNRYRRQDKVDMLQSMLNSRLGLFSVTGIDDDEGYAYFKDVFIGTEHKITDIGMSGNKNHGDYYIYTRIINYNGVCFGSGLNFMFDKKDLFIQDFIKRHKKTYHTQAEFSRFIELYNRYSKDKNKVTFKSNRY